MFFGDHAISLYCFSYERDLNCKARSTSVYLCLSVCVAVGRGVVYVGVGAESRSKGGERQVEIYPTDQKIMNRISDGSGNK
jgi:hypothetical protein